MAAKKKGGGAGLVIIIIVAVGLFYFGRTIFSNRGSSNNGSVTTDYETTDESRGEGGLNGADSGGVWPPGLGSTNVELEEDLLIKNYYIVFDGSGSMEGDRLATAKEALKRFVQFVPEDAHIGLMVFDGSGISERVPLGGSVEQFRIEVDRVIADGGTPLKDAIGLAYDKLNRQALKQLGYGEYNLVIVTDGEASSGYEPDRVVRDILRQSPVTIHTIGFQIGSNHSLNQPGKILYKSADNLEELSQGLEGVLAELEEFDLADFQDEN